MTTVWWWTVQARTARAERSEGNQSPSRALISARFPTRRNVYQERRRQTIRSGDFFVAEVTGRGPERAKAGHHYDGGILPFVLYGAFEGNRCARAYLESLYTSGKV